MNTATAPVSALMAASKALDQIGAELGRDMPIRQLHTLVLVVAAGPSGIDVAKLAQLTGSSSAAVSRNVRVLGTYHYDRSKGEGMGLLTVELDMMDNRRRVASATEKGVEIINRFVTTMR